MHLPGSVLMPRISKAEGVNESRNEWDKEGNSLSNSFFQSVILYRTALAFQKVFFSGVALLSSVVVSIQQKNKQIISFQAMCAVYLYRR